MHVCSDVHDTYMCMRMSCIMSCAIDNNEQGPLTTDNGRDVVYFWSSGLWG